jgi:hypothetical protein
MKHFYRLFIAFCLFGCGTVAIQAQNSIPATGGNADGTGGTVSYTIGQLVYTPITGETGMVSQGVQQPFDITVITAIEEASEISLEISVYPNPAVGYVNLKIGKYDTYNLRYMLFDMNGMLFQERKVEGDETLIQLGNLLPGIYFLRVTDNKKEIKTFKIIKK